MPLAELDPKEFSDTTIFLDIDGTIVSDKGDVIDEHIADLVSTLKVGNDLYLASNGHALRTEEIAKDLGVGFLPQLRKPLSHPAVRSIARRSRVVVIGDKFLTDGLFAKKIGAEFIKIDHLRSEQDAGSTRISYGLDYFAWRTIPFLSLMRPMNWLKNMLVFMPLFFSGELFSANSFSASVWAFIAFSVAASGVYVVNDLFDRDADCSHPKKKNRPLASGRVGLTAAYTLLAALALIEILLLAKWQSLAPVIILYICLNGAYSAWFKHIAVIDIVTVASFYVMRVIAGGVVTGVPLSSWIICCVFFGALFLITGKRRSEFQHDIRRKVLETYSKEALDAMLIVSVALTIISYGLYTILGHASPRLIYSTVFVVLAVFRILNRIYTHPDQTETPEQLLFRDPFVFGAFVAWAAYLFVFFYYAV